MIDQSIFLWGLPILLLPWILRLIKTQKPLVVAFSQSYLLKKVVDAYRPKQRKNPWWLILLRMFILTLLVLLIAGLLLPKSHTRGPVSLILMLDNSLYSHAMDQQNQTLWQHSIDKAVERLSEYSLQTKVALVTSSGDHTDWQPITQAILDLQSRKPSYRLEHWNRVKGQLQRLLRQREHDDLQLVYIGDGKSANPEAMLGSLSTFPKDRVDIVEIAHPQRDNFFISGKAKSVSKGTVLELFVSGPSQSQVLQFEISNAKQEKETQSIHWKGQAFYTQIKLEGPHWKQGQLKLLVEDQYDFDNHLFFNIEQSDRKQLILFQHRQAEKRLQDSGYYLEKALVNLASQHNYDFRSIAPNSWKTLSGGKGDLLFLNDPPFLSQEESDRISQFLRRGGKALIMPGPLTSPDALHASLAEFLPAKLKEQSRQQVSIDIPESWPSHLKRLKENPFRGHWLFYEAHPQSETLMRFDNGSPFWIKRALSQGEIHLLSSPFHIAYSDALIQNDILELLYQVTTMTDENAQNHLGLIAGEAVPKEVESILPILTYRQNFNVAYVEPGIYEAQVLGQKNILHCNAPRLNLSERLPIQNLRGDNSTFTNLNSGSRRMDVELTLLLLLALLIEIFALSQLQKPKAA